MHDLEQEMSHGNQLQTGFYKKCVVDSNYRQYLTGNVSWTPSTGRFLLKKCLIQLQTGACGKSLMQCNYRIPERKYLREASDIPIQPGNVS